MRDQKWPWLGSRLGHARLRETAWPWSILRRWLGQASRPPLEGSASNQPWARPSPRPWLTSCLLSWWMLGGPRGELTYARQAEWELSVKRLVQNHAATAEAATFKNAIKTLQELYHFQILRGRAVRIWEVDPIDLDAFLHGGTTAPTRGLQALRWISKNAQAPVDVA